MIERYQDIALRLAARLVEKDLSDLDLRVLKAYFTLAEEDAPPPGSRDQTLRRTEAVSPPKGATAALLPLGLAFGKAQPRVEGDPLLAAVVVVFYAYLFYLLARRS